MDSESISKCLGESIPKITGEVAVMFLFAQLHMNEISSKRRSGAVRKALTSLPLDIDATHDQGPERIKSLLEDDKIVALKRSFGSHVLSYQSRPTDRADEGPRKLSVVRLLSVSGLEIKFRRELCA